MERIIALLLTACLMSCGARQQDPATPETRSPDSVSPKTDLTNLPTVTEHDWVVTPYRVLGPVSVNLEGYCVDDPVTAGDVARVAGTVAIYTAWNAGLLLAGGRGGGLATPHSFEDEDPNISWYDRPAITSILAAVGSARQSLPHWVHHEAKPRLAQAALEKWPETDAVIHFGWYWEKGVAENCYADGMAIAELTAEEAKRLPPPTRPEWQRTDAAEPGRRITINPTPASGDDSALASLLSLRVKIEDFNDSRYPRCTHLAAGSSAMSTSVTCSTGSEWAGKIGRSRYDQMISGEEAFSIYVPRATTELIRDVVAAQWQAAGHVLVEEDQNLTVTGYITRFEASTSGGGIWGYGAATVLDVVVEIRGGTIGSETLTRKYRSEHEDLSFSGPTEPLEVTVSACVEDLMRQIASDTEVVRFLGDRPAEAATAS